MTEPSHSFVVHFVFHFEAGFDASGGADAEELELPNPGALALLLSVAARAGPEIIGPSAAPSECCHHFVSNLPVEFAEGACSALKSA